MYPCFHLHIELFQEVEALTRDDGIHMDYYETYLKAFVSSKDVTDTRRLNIHYKKVAILLNVRGSFYPSQDF